MDADHSAPTAFQNAETGAWGQALDHALSTECHGTRFSGGVTYLQSEDGAWTTRANGRLESRDTIIDNMVVLDLAWKFQLLIFGRVSLDAWFLVLKSR
jgi:hypothetical protein